MSRNGEHPVLVCLESLGEQPATRRSRATENAADTAAAYPAFAAPDALPTVTGVRPDPVTHAAAHPAIATRPETSTLSAATETAAAAPDLPTVRAAQAGRIIPSGRIIAVASGESVGGTAMVHVRIAERVADFGLHIDPSHRRRGYGHAALAQMLDRARGAEDIDWVRTTVSAEASAARHFLEGAGFTDRGPAWDEVAGLTHTFLRYVG